MAGSSLNPVELDEAIGLLSAELDERDDLVELLARCGADRLRGRSYAVLRLPARLPATLAQACLAAIAGRVDELIVVADDDERRRWGALTCADIRALGRPGLCVTFEPERERAITGTLLRLRPGDGCWILAAREPGPSLHVLIQHGIRRRGEWPPRP